MGWRGIFGGVFLILVFASQRALAAELSPIHFVSSGSAGIVEVIKFSEKQGFFKKQGLDVTMIYVPSGVLAAQTVVSGSALIANNSVSDILNAIAAGAPLKILTVNIDRFQHLFVARPGINSPKEMKGKKVAVSRYGAFSDIDPVSHPPVGHGPRARRASSSDRQFGGALRGINQWRCGRRRGDPGFCARGKKCRPQRDLRSLDDQDEIREHRIDGAGKSDPRTAAAH